MTPDSEYEAGDAPRQARGGAMPYPDRLADPSETTTITDRFTTISTQAVILAAVVGGWIALLSPASTA